MKPTILVTGGTGYIGSHTCVDLLAAGARRATSIPCAAMLGAGSNGRQNTLPNYDKAAGSAPATSGSVPVLTVRLASDTMAHAL